MKTYYVVIFYFTLMVACSSKSDYKDEVVDLKSPVELQSIKISVDAELLAPSKLFIYKDKLISYENISNNKFKVFRISDVKFLYGFGSTGSGPSDFGLIDKESINISDEVEVLDNNVLKSIEFRDSNAIIVKSKLISINKDLINKLRKINDTIYFCDNWYTKKDPYEYKILNVNSYKTSLFGELTAHSIDRQKDEDVSQLNFQYMKSNCYNDFYSRFFAFYFHFPVCKIFDDNGNLVRKFSIKYEKVGKPELQNKIFFTEPYATDKYVYVMWVDKNKKDVTLNMADFKPQLFVFDWNGNFVANYLLDQPIITFAVSEEQRKIYGVSFTEPDAIFEYEMPGLDDLEFDSITNDYYSVKMLKGFHYVSNEKSVYNNSEFINGISYNANLLKQKAPKIYPDLQNIKITYCIPQSGRQISESDMRGMININGFKDVKIRNIIIAGMKTLYASYTFIASDQTKKEIPVYYNHFVILKDNRLVSIEVGSLKADFDKYKSQFYDIITHIYCKV